MSFFVNGCRSSGSFNSNNGNSSGNSFPNNFGNFSPSGSQSSGNFYSSGNFSGGARNATVRDCMQWPGAFQSMAQVSSSAVCGGAGYSGSLQYPSEPKAFVAGGEGRGESVRIPIKIAPSGVNPTSLLEPMEPITVRVGCPNRSADGGPIRFTLNPADIYKGIPNCSTQPYNNNRCN